MSPRGADFSLLGFFSNLLKRKISPKSLQSWEGADDGSKMGSLSPPDNFYLYLWRSPNSPGTLYLAKGFETAEALCRGLTEDGYIVKVIHMTSDTEFELCDGKLRPMASGSPDQENPSGPSSQGQSGGQGMSPAFA